MTRLLRRQSRDGNERGIIEALEHVGATVIQMDASTGFDLLVAWRGRLTALEVKQPGGKLTPHEQDILRVLRSQDAPVYVINDVDDALRAVGAVWL